MLNKQIRSVLFATVAALAVTACGADDVASPGEGNLVVLPSPTPTPAPTPTPTPAPGTPAADCPTGFVNAGVLANNRVCQIPNSIQTALTVPQRAGTIYSMSGRVEVGTDVGGDGAAAGGVSSSLTVEPGVVVFAQSATTFLIVNRGSKLNAPGTANSPIIFTSRQNIEGTTTDSDTNQWGGILLLGRAPISNCIGAVAGGTAGCQQLAEGAGPQDFYGGNQAADNSGTISYLQVRYTGRAAAANKELQGLTLGGVGSGTSISYVQIHNSGDDGIEIFGGTVNLKNLIITGADDDSLDTDVGYKGAIQFVIAVQNTSGGDTMWEVDSDDDSGFDLTPRQDVKLANFTFIQRHDNDKAIHLRGGPDAAILNGVIVGPNFCLDVDQAETVQAADPAKDELGPPRIRSVVGACAGGDFDTDSDTFEATAFNAAGNTNNNFAFVSTLVSLFINGSNEAAVSPVANISSFSPDLTQVDYIGAVRDINDLWYQSWSCNASYADLGALRSCASSPVS